MNRVVDALYIATYNATVRRRWLILVLSLVCLGTAASVRGETIRVGAAISLQEALAEIATAYASGGDRIELIVGSSGQIATQIERGAAIDVYIAAAAEPMEKLIASGLVDAATRRVVAGNSLVLIIPVDAAGPMSFDTIGKASRVAIGEPSSVPAGMYAMQVLRSIGVAEKLRGKLVYGANVRQVLAYVESGDAGAGIVYATDAGQSKVRLVATADATMHEPIVYPAAIVTSSTHRAAAEKVVKFLTSADAKKILRAHGFTTPDEPSTRPAGQ